MVIFNSYFDITRGYRFFPTRFGFLPPERNPVIAAKQSPWHRASCPARRPSAPSCGRRSERATPRTPRGSGSSQSPNGGGSWGRLPSGYVKIAIEAMAIEIVDFPLKNGWIFHSYVKLPEGIMG